MNGNLRRRVILTRPTRSAVVVKPSTTTRTAPLSTTPKMGGETHNAVVFRPPTGDNDGDRARVAAHASSGNLADLLHLIQSLPESDRKELLDRAAAHQLLTTVRPQDRELGMWTAAVYTAYQQALGAASPAGVGPGVLRKLLAAASSWAPVKEFMLASRLDGATVQVRQAVYSMLAELLVVHTRKVARYTGAPFSAKMIAGQTQYLAGVFDNAFPGYLASGLVRVVAQQFTRSHA